MGNAFLYGNGGGGGNALAFRVLSGTSAPSSPKENDIWVNTSTAITSYVFSATQPTGSNGMVWIYVGTSSVVEFNALKKNRLNVYPISAKQYISGKFTDKTAKTYQNGAWMDWAKPYYFVEDGETKTNHTFIGSQASTLASADGLLTIRPSGDSYRGLYFSGTKIGNTTFNTEGVFTGNKTYIRIWDKSTTPTDSNFVASAAVDKSNGRLDISAFADGEYFFGFCSLYNETNKIANLWIE